MNVEKDGRKRKVFKSLRLVCLVSVSYLYLASGGSDSLLGQGGRIVLGTIEAELKKKGPALDFGKTPKSLTPLVAKAVSLHGGLRLARPEQSRYSVLRSPWAEASSNWKSPVAIRASRNNLSKAWSWRVLPLTERFSRAVTIWWNKFSGFPVSFPANYAISPMFPDPRRSSWPTP